MVDLYLDVCCLNRPFDDQAQDRVRLEAEAILLILARIRTGEWSWTGSEVMDSEVDQTPDPGRRNRVRLLMRAIGSTIVLDGPELARAQELATLGFHPFDALHLACAESAEVDVLLTTDDRMLRRAKRLSADLRVRVENPLIWLTEVTGP